MRSLIALALLAPVRVPVMPSATVGTDTCRGAEVRRGCER